MFFFGVLISVNIRLFIIKSYREFLFLQGCSAGTGISSSLFIFDVLLHLRVTNSFDENIQFYMHVSGSVFHQKSHVVESHTVKWSKNKCLNFLIEIDLFYEIHNINKSNCDSRLGFNV